DLPTQLPQPTSYVAQPLDGDLLPVGGHQEGLHVEDVALVPHADTVVTSPLDTAQRLVDLADQRVRIGTVVACRARVDQALDRAAYVGPAIPQDRHTHDQRGHRVSPPQSHADPQNTHD